MPRDPLQCSHTKIVATVGPACSTREQLAQMVAAGVDIFRLNMAHAGPDVQQKHVDIIRSLEEEFKEPIAILIDLSGPKIRLGKVADDRLVCSLNQEFFFIDGHAPQAPNELTSTYPPLTEELHVGDRVMLADGTVSMEVVAKSAGRVQLKVIQRGAIRSHQGINLPGVKLSAPAISESDRAHAIWGAKAGVDFVGLSFVRSPADIYELKEILTAHGSTARVVAKIEKREALDNLEEISALKLTWRGLPSRKSGLWKPAIAARSRSSSPRRCSTACSTRCVLRGPKRPTWPTRFWTGPTRACSRARRQWASIRGNPWR